MRQAMTKVIVHTPEPREGAALYVFELVKALRQAAVPVTLLCPSNFEYAPQLEDTGIPVVRALARPISRASLLVRLWRNALWVAKTAALQWKLTSRGDVVHFQFLIHLPLGFIFLLLVRLRGARVVLTAHDPLPHKWRLPSSLRWLEHKMIFWAYRLCDKVLVHNQVGKSILLGDFHFFESRIATIPHGPLAPVKASSEYPRFDVLRLLLFGSIRENKGFHLAIEAVQRLNARLGRCVRLTIAGSVTSAHNEYWNSCKKLIGRDADDIEVIESYIEDAAIPGLFSRHHAVLMPYQDFFSESGVASLGLSNERPLIATGAGGLAELLTESGGGILIETPTVEGLERAITAALNLGHEGLLQMGRDGGKYLRRSRSWESIACATREMYERLSGAADALDKSSQLHVVLHSPEPVSSPSLYIEALSLSLADDGVTVDLVCPANLQSRSTIERNARVRVHPTAERSIDRARGLLHKALTNCHFLFSSLAVLSRTCRRGSIVHLQYVMHFPLGALFFLLSWLRGGKIVFTVHDPLPHKWLLPKWLRPLEVSSLRWAYQVSSRLVVHSEPGRQTLISYFGIDASKIQVIAHGPYSLGQGILPMVQSDCLEVLLFGSLRENKGAHLAIQAVQQLFREGVRIRLTIAGAVLNSRERQYWTRCGELIAKCPEPICVMEEFIPDEKLPSLFSNCHCLLLPYTSFFSDSGVAYMALANGRPIIATRMGGLASLLESSGGGFAIEEATVGGVVKALRKAVELGPAQLQLLGQIGTERVMAECGWPTVAKKTHQLYESISPRSVVLQDQVTAH